MTRLKLLLAVCALALVPAQARADDGWWLEWLWKMDPKLVGVGASAHLCVDQQNKIMDCDEWWGLHPLFNLGSGQRKFTEIKDQIDFRYGLYWKYGQRFDTSANPLDLPDLRQIQAFKLMGEYHRYIHPYLAIGGGGGALHFMGDGFESFTGPTANLNVIVAPFKTGVLKPIFFRPEIGYLFTSLTAAKFGNNISPYSNGGGERTYSVTVGFDARRRAME